MVSIVVRVTGVEILRRPFTRDVVQVSLETPDNSAVELRAQIMVPLRGANPCPLMVNQELPLADVAALARRPLAADPSNPGDESGIATMSLVAERCDGNHPAPACNWSECWHLEPQTL
jgi:hypothetical protein